MRYQVPMQVTGIGTLLNIHPVFGPIDKPEDVAKGDMRLRRLLFLHLLDEGIYVAERGFMPLSLLIAEKEGALLLAAIERFINRYRNLLIA